MAKPLRIAPSILSADFSRLGEEAVAMERAGADQLHVDVMDGHFVPNISFGPVVMQALRPHVSVPFDVHLMISPVDPYLDALRAAGADAMTVHPEAGPHLDRTLRRIRELGARAGVAFDPSTPVEVVDDLLEQVDVLLVMTVNPGFGGQSFIPAQLRKVERLRRLVEASGLPIDVGVDGGVDPQSARRCVDAGADVLVAGGSAFRGGPGAYADNLRALRGGPAAA